jgi:uncharacterized protein (DUF302 family)
MLQLRYGSSVTSRHAFADTVARVKELLKEQGFGVLCEIDVSRTLKDKIGVDFRPYVIVGACNPRLAHQALERDNQLGLLLPCNIVVQQEEDSIVVSAVDARALLGIVGRPELVPIADDVNRLLWRVLDGFA